MSEHRLGEIVIERPRVGTRINQKKVTGYKKTLYKLTQEAIEDELIRPHIIKNRWRTKHFSDNLSPLRRWLRSKVGLHWDIVYSELSQKIETKTLAGQHLLFHLLALVQQNVVLIDGVPYSQSGLGYTNSHPLGYWGEELYVHPNTKILCLAKKTPKVPPKKPDNILVIDEYHSYHKLNDVWYLLTLEEIPDKHRITDANLKQKLQYLETRWVGGKFYIVRKRQCNKKEVKWIMQQLNNN